MLEEGQIHNMYVYGDVSGDGGDWTVHGTIFNREVDGSLGTSASPIGIDAERILRIAAEDANGSIDSTLNGVHGLASKVLITNDCDASIPALLLDAGDLGDLGIEIGGDMNEDIIVTGEIQSTDRDRGLAHR